MPHTKTMRVSSLSIFGVGAYWLPLVASQSRFATGFNLDNYAFQKIPESVS